ncbi:conserved hypothetical protein [Ricinus communis]|uniref:Uncharacterized protein n=1 Tax=Ricinus communis TaxID=3988 RepID=B9SCR0_RICCO|nr:conserved hypothetical protein [Ricinus communis]
MVVFWGGRLQTHGHMDKFRSCLDACGIGDMGFQAIKTILHAYEMESGQPVGEF